MNNVVKILTISDATTAYNLELGFVPDWVTVENVTEWATDSKITEFKWYRGMGDGYYMAMENLSTVATNGRKPVLGTSNGFTPYNSSSFAAKQLVIDTGSAKVTKATNAVVTITGHGLSTGDKVSFQSVLYGMTELNGLRSTITYLTADTFSCDDIDSSNFTTWSASDTAAQCIVVSDITDNAGKQGVTIGTDVLATNADVLVVKAGQFDNYASVTQA